MGLLLIPYSQHIRISIFRHFKKIFRTKMCTSVSNGDNHHIERTAHSKRQHLISEATISNVYNLSPTVKGITLNVENKDLRFKPGQWVDVFIPNVNQVGGFSMVSTPSLLVQKSKLELAIKFSSWPPAFWFHTQSKVGDKVDVRVGGNFFYDPSFIEKEKTTDLLFIAGGVGINPLIAIIQHLANKQPKSGFLKNINLLYSAKTEEEILFKDTISTVKQNLETFNYKYFVTGQNNGELEANFKRGRLTEEDLNEVINGTENLLCFLCGPPPMIENCVQKLTDLGLPSNRIILEKWW